LTRIGPSAKCIITGDLSQIDLPFNQRSGLRHALDILGDVKGIAKVRLTADDVVRHRLVKEIIKAYDKSDQKRRDRRMTGQENRNHPASAAEIEGEEE